MAIRAALPLEVLEVFLIHRDSGLLIRHLSHSHDGGLDSDLISGMLTAIRDFVQDAFGRGEEGYLDEIHYSDMRIFIEAGKYAYCAVVVRGFEPIGYRAELRDRVFRIEHEFYRVLRDYDGDASALKGVEDDLRPLLNLGASVKDADGNVREIQTLNGHAGAGLGARSVTQPRPLLASVTFFLFSLRIRPYTFAVASIFRALNTGTYRVAWTDC